MKNLILAIRNIKAYKNFYIKYILVLTFLILLITLLVSYIRSLSLLQGEMQMKSVSANYLLSNEPIKSNIELKDKEEWKVYILDENQNSDSFEIDFNKFIIERNDKEFYNNNHLSSGNIFSGDVKKLVHKNDLLAHEFANKKGKPLIIGNLPLKDDEILVSEKILKDFLLEEPIIDSIIKIKHKTTKVTILDNLKIVGIISEDYYNLKGHEIGFNPVIVGNNNFGEKNFLIGNQTIYRYNLDEYLKEEEYDKISKKQDIFYGAYYLFEVLTNIENIQEITEKLFSLIVFSISFGILMILGLLCLDLIKIFSRNSGILLTLGISKNNLYLTFFIQLVIVGLISTIISLFINFAILNLINFMIYRIYSFEIIISYGLFFFTWIISILLILVISMILLLIIFYINKKNSIIDFLVENNKF